MFSEASESEKGSTQFNMRIAKVFSDNQARVNAMSFHRDGKFLAVSSDDGTLHIYNAMTASEKKNIFCKKYGIDLVKYTHSDTSVISASRNGWDETIRHLDLHKNCFLNYFKGHRDRVTSLSVSPTSNTVVSTSLDGTARIWDISIPKCQGRINQIYNSAATIDPSGAVLAIVSDTPKDKISNNRFVGMDISLYDIRCFEKGPFANKSLELCESRDDFYSCVSVQFSNDGKNILISTNKDSLFVVDGFFNDRGKDVPLRELSCSKDQKMTSLVHPTFSPDDKSVIAGTDDGAIVIWNIENNDFSKKENIFLSKPTVVNAHPLPINVVSYNPRYDMLASACACVSLWLPASSLPPSSTSN